MSALADINSLEEAAEYLRLTPEAIVRLARAKKLGSIKIGRTRTFPREALEEFAAANTVKAEPNAWGLTDSSLRGIREGRTTRRAS